MRGLRMKKCNQLVGSALERHFMNQLDSTARGLIKLTFNIICAERDVMNAFTTLLQEFRNWAVFSRWLK